MIRCKYLVGLSIVVAVTLLITGLAIGKELSREEIIAEAKKEGKLMYYFAGDISRKQKVVNTFKKKYPFIDVRMWEASHSKIYQKLQLEKRIGKVTADVISFSNPLYFIYLKNAGMLLYYLSPEHKHYRHLLEKGKIGFHYDQGYWTPYRIDFPLIVYRTDKWSKKNAPKSWKDLLNPKYKGEILFPDPRYGEDEKFIFYGLKEQLGTDYLKKLADNDIMFAVRGGGVKMKLITGERSIGIIGTRWVMRALLHDKAPIDFFIPEEGGPAFLKNVAILKDAPHPNCARLFIDYFLSQENIEFLRDDGYEIGTRDDFLPKENKVTLETYKKVWPFNSEKFMKEIDGVLKEFVRIFRL